MDPSYEYTLQTPRRTRQFEVDPEQIQASPCSPPAPWPTPMTPPRTPLKPLQFCEYSDRLIPSRAGSNMETGFDLLTENHGPRKVPGHFQGGDPSAFARLLRNELLGLASPGPSDREELRTPERGLFRYKSQPEEMETSALLSVSTCMETPCKVARRFPAAPYKVLSAPGLEDDYYLNLLDWSSEDQLAVGLGRDVDLWNASTGRASRLCELDTSVCSLRWPRRCCNHLALGLANGDVQIWDTSAGVQLQVLRGHRRRCCAVSWASHVDLFSGSQDTSILHWDLREPCDGRPAQRLAGHAEEVCGLSWSEELQLLASGGNEGDVLLWSRGTLERRLGSHTAACKALDWSPRGVLATGGRTADRSIRLWNGSTGMQLAQAETDAQVCNLAWSQDGELISTHGFSTCEVSIWKNQAGGLSQVHAFHWHQARVLYLAMSPDHQNAAMGTGNEMLCFWHLSPKQIKASPASSSSLSISEGSSLSLTIR